jgi:hypothetical protein
VSNATLDLASACRPTNNSTYGELGHRKERQFELGTEKKIFTESEFEKLPSTKDQTQISSHTEPVE